MALCRFIYGTVKEYLCYERVLHVQDTSVDDSLIYYYIEKTIKPPSGGGLGASSVGASCHFSAEPLHDWVTAQMGMRLALRSFKRHKRKLSIISLIIRPPPRGSAA